MLTALLGRRQVGELHKELMRDVAVEFWRREVRDEAARHDDGEDDFLERRADDVAAIVGNGLLAIGIERV